MAVAIVVVITVIVVVVGRLLDVLLCQRILMSQAGRRAR